MNVNDLIIDHKIIINGLDMRFPLEREIDLTLFKQVLRRSDAYGDMESGPHQVLADT
jgi:hypothetical protein